MTACELEVIQANRLSDVIVRIQFVLYDPLSYCICLWR